VKESKFIELLNLYIDQQISPEETGLLEEDIQHNARHRRIYHQYCQMHRACTLVLEDLGTRAEPAATGAEQLTGRIVAFEPRARRWGWGYTVAALAAAACVALVAVQMIQRPLKNPAGRSVATLPVTGPASHAPGLAVATGPVRIDAPAYQDRGLPTGAFVARRLALRSPGGLPATASLIMVHAAPGGALLAPLPLVNATARPPRPSIEQFVFEPSPAPSENPQIFRGRRSTDSEAERTAYQFKR
jgi:hypothetical protein